jgi:hypothetical protein
MFWDEKSILHTKHRYIKNSLLCTLSVTDNLWYNGLGSSLTMCNVFLIQKRIIRIMLGLGPRSFCRDGFKKLVIPMVPSLYIFALITFVVRNPDHLKSKSSIHSTDPPPKNTTFTVSTIFFTSYGRCMTWRNWKQRIGLATSRIAISGNYVLRKPKHSKIEVVVHKEEDEKLPICL